MRSVTISVTALKMTPRQQAQPNAWLFDNLVVFEAHLPIPSFRGLSDVRNRGMNTLFLCQRLFEVAFKLKYLPYYEAQNYHNGL